MKVKDLINDLKGYNQEAEVFFVKDWEKVEDGILTDRYILTDICSQTVTVDMGMDFENEQQVLLCFEEERW